MYIRVDACSARSGDIITLKCPTCGNGGTFHQLGDQGLVLKAGGQHEYYVYHRRCPNPHCLAYLFTLTESDGHILATFPAVRIDFNTEKIPPRIRDCLEQAITCHAQGCYIASAIMVRRTLEELCEEKGCKGDNLKKRIEGLRSAIVLPEELFGALDELRLLGNDAAHLESREYDNIGKEEVTVAIELTKEVLKGIYQMDTLVAKLRGLKKPKKP